MNKNLNKTIDYYMSLKYPVIISREEDGSFFIEYPDLEGCFSCGDTLDEALEMGEDARKEWTVTAIENNIFIPEPKIADNCPETYKMHLPKSLYRQLQQNAKREGCSMNQYCVYLLSKGCLQS